MPHRGGGSRGPQSPWSVVVAEGADASSVGGSIRGYPLRSWRGSGEPGGVPPASELRRKKRCSSRVR